jgi:hypothetical protein
MSQKCDLKIPQCSACERQCEVCNITEYVAYPYALVESLHLKVKELENRLGSHKNDSICEPAVNEHGLGPSFNGLPPTSGKLASSADASKEAEEVGGLAIGFVDWYSHAKYGRSNAQVLSGYTSICYLIEITSGRCCGLNFR